MNQNTQNLNKVVLHLKNNIVSRHLRTRDSLEKQLMILETSMPTSNSLVHYMYNYGEKMTTAKAMELTGRSRKFIVKTMKKLQELGMVDWYGAKMTEKSILYFNEKLAYP